MKFYSKKSELKCVPKHFSDLMYHFWMPRTNVLPIKAALADWKKVVRGGFFLVLPFLVFEKSVVVAAMAAWAEAVQGQG